MSELNKSIKVFSQLYVGLKEQHDNDVPLGFATPFATDAAFEKRKATVDTWSRGYGRWETQADGTRKYVTKDIVTKVMDNTARAGFKVTDDVKRVYWGGGNVVWRVYDPDGFELEISSQNLMALIQVAGVEPGGLIPGSCLWGREGAKNVLLHEKSEEFQNAIMAAEKITKPKELKAADKIIGNYYKLLDGNTARYLGKVWVTSMSSNNERRVISVRDPVADASPANSYFQADLRGQAITTADRYEAVQVSEDGHIRFYKKAPLVLFVRAEPITPEAAIDVLNAWQTHWNWATSNYYSEPAMVSLAAPDTVRFTTRKLSAERFEKVKLSCIPHAQQQEQGAYFSHWALSCYHLPWMCLQHDGVLYTTPTGGGIYGANFFVPAILEEGAFYTCSHLSRYTYGQSQPGKSVLRVPDFTSLEEAQAWLQGMYDDGHLVEVVAEAV